MKILEISFPFTPKTLVSFVFFVVCCSSMSAQDRIDLIVEYQNGNLHEVTAQYEHSGVLIVNKAGQDQESKSLPMEVNAQINYGQRFTGNSEQLLAIRNYGRTVANIQIDKGSAQSTLADENRLIVARIQPNSSQVLQLASISNVLKQAELELIRNPADPLSFAQMFSHKNVRVGDKWKVDSETLAAFLAVDQVYENNVQLALKSYSSGIAKVYLMGSVKAEIDDVTSEIEVSGISLIDINKKHLTALRTTLTENRKPGQVAPGFKGQTKIDLKMVTKTSIPQLSNDALALSKSKRIERRIKWESKASEFQIVYDPRWRIIASEDEAAILRYVDRGDLLAQCNIVQLPSRPADNTLKMEQFKAEVTKIIRAENSAKVLKSEEIKTNNGLKALRVVVNGVESRIPVQWIYYHVAADDGRRLTYVFTLEQEIVDRFATADKQLVDATVFKPKKIAKTPKSRSAEFKRTDTPSSRR